MALLDPTFDDRDGQIWFDGRLVPWRDARVHVLTHALHYASAVFEGLRCYGGTPFALSQHSQRLIDSAEAARLRPAVVARRRSTRRSMQRSRRTA